MFQMYKTTRARSPDAINIENMTNFSKDFGLIPEMVSKPDVARLFRGVQSTLLHTTYIDVTDFTRVCCFIGISHFSTRTPTRSLVECIDAFFDALETNSGILERTYGTNKRNPQVLENFT
jgi:hypothetical protein